MNLITVLLLTTASLFSCHSATQGSSVNDPMTTLNPTSPASQPQTPVQVATDSSSDLFLTPDPNGHQVIIEQIASAKKSLKMWIFSMTDMNVVQAIIDSKNRGVAVSLIMDRGMFKTNVPSSDPNLVQTPGAPVKQGGFEIELKQKAVSALRSAGIEPIEATAKFSITHAKTMILDDQAAWITTMNLTMRFAAQRDTGLRVTDPTIVADLVQLFAADVKNSQQNDNQTPEIQSQSLVVSPTNSRDRILGLLQSAQKSIDLTVENLIDDKFISELILASQRNVQVRIVVPLCSVAGGPSMNRASLQRLNAAGVAALAMPGPATRDTPYMHQKMFIVDANTAYIGSENFSMNSLDKAREIGILFADREKIARLESAFDQDFNVSVKVDADQLKTCQAVL
jgi:phosphatidylserine/phosphatidylglycerophosphate/cardiolipin synthase-like enzyme